MISQIGLATQLIVKPPSVIISSFLTGDYFLYPGCSVEVIVSNITNASNAFLDPIRNCSPYEGMALSLSFIVSFGSGTVSRTSILRTPNIICSYSNLPIVNLSTGIEITKFPGTFTETTLSITFIFQAVESCENKLQDIKMHINRMPDLIFTLDVFKWLYNSIPE